MDSKTSIFAQVHFQFKVCLICVLSIISFTEILIVATNSVYLDRTLLSVASDLGLLHGLSRSLVLVTRH